MRKIKFIAVLFCFVFAACADSANNTDSSSEFKTSDASVETAATEKSTGGAPVQQVSLNQTENAQNAPTATERKIIRNAELTLETDAPEQAQQKITAIAEGKGGFVVESAQSSSSAKAATRDTVTMTVRVPAAKFNETLDELRKTGSRVVTETVKGQDVTEEFIDIEARLKTKRALEEQFLEIMKRGNTVQDALNVQRELATVRGEIEQIEGRKRFLESQSSLSTFKIRLQTPAVFAGNSAGFFSQLANAVSTGINGALSVVLFLITALIALLPFLLFIVLPIYLLLRYFWRKGKKQKLASEIARDEIRSE